MASKVVSSVFRQGLFDGRSAIVTGGGTGIGKAITEELLYLGCRVMIASRKMDRLSAAAESIKKAIPSDSPAQLEYMQCNIRKEEDVSNLIKTTLEKFGKIDFLVNNGGGQFPSPAQDISLKGWNAVVETNLTGTFLMCREVYNRWMCDHGGVIINMVLDIWNAHPMLSHSAAARAGIDNLTKSLSMEWASSGVRINVVAPGSVFSSTAAANYKAGSDLFASRIPHIPAKRLGTPEEVSATVMFLCSPAAAYISGETIKIDGAQFIYRADYPIEDHKKLPAYKWDNAAEKSKL